MHLYNFFVCAPKFTRFPLSNVEGVVVDHLCFRFLIRRPVLEIFAIKVESCQKSRRNLDVFFALPNFRGRAFQKLYTRYHPCLEKFHEDIPTSPEVIGVHTLNFKPNFKFSRLEFFEGTPVPLRVCAIKAWSISSACKNLRAQHPLRVETLCLKNVHLGGSICTSITFSYVDQSSPGFFCPTWEGCS